MSVQTFVHVVSVDVKMSLKKRESFDLLTMPQVMSENHQNQ